MELTNDDQGEIQRFKIIKVKYMAHHNFKLILDNLKSKILSKQFH